jgi:hypothetical protein
MVPPETLRPLTAVLLRLPPLIVAPLIVLEVVTTPLKVMPPEPDWTTVLEVVLVLPTVVVWAVALVPTLTAPVPLAFRLRAVLAPPAVIVRAPVPVSEEAVRPPLNVDAVLVLAPRPVTVASVSASLVR